MIDEPEGLEVVAAWDAIEAAVRPLDTETVPLAAAAGRVLRQRVAVDRDQPPFDRAAMDGFAVRRAEVEAASAAAPVRLRVVGESTPGAPFTGSAAAGETVRIMTGAPLPDAFDAVVPVESTSGFGSDEVAVRAAPSGDHFTPRARERRAGELLFESGRRLNAADIGGLALVGAIEVTVGRRPRVAILSTGNELVAAHESPSSWGIRNSNGPMLAALAATYARQIVPLGIAPDRPAALAAAVREGLACDVLLVTGGVSMGAYDWVGDTLRAAGVQIEFERVALQPGKPTVFGTHPGGLVVALPGNPVSALTTFRLFAALALGRLEGATDARPRFTTLPAAFEWQRKRAKWLVLPGERRSSDGTVALSPYAGSGDVLAYARADCQVVLRRGIDRVRRGDPVPVWPLGEA